MCECPCHYTVGACFCTCKERAVSFETCPCHVNDGFYMCINGAVYGPCESEVCGGICIDVNDCESPEGCCGC